MKTLVIIATITWGGLWLTPDQQGQRLLKSGESNQAAKTFADPMWQGVAWYRAGEFKKAVQSFAKVDTAEAHFNQGNAWLMQGKYELAITSYDRALGSRHNWKEAIENRALASARAEKFKQTGGDMGEQKIGADKTVFDKNAKNEGQDTEVTSGKQLSDQQIQALWLRRVQTRPADFLRSKFSYQQANQENRTKGDSQ
jgi:Ca-activated chloride channel family protein